MAYNGNKVSKQQLAPSLQKEIDDAKVEVVDGFDSSSKSEALSANKGRELKIDIVTVKNKLNSIKDTILIGAVDFNAVTTNGAYFCDKVGATNKPPKAISSVGWLIVEMGTDAYAKSCVQTFVHSGDSKIAMWKRLSLSNGAWGTWQKILNEDDYNTLFQYVSNGKKEVANAITRKGVTTSPTAEFATMAQNIGKIPAGKRQYVGKVTSSSTSRGFPDYQNQPQALYYTTIYSDAIGFTPSMIIAHPTNYRTDYTTNSTIVYPNKVSTAGSSVIASVQNDNGMINISDISRNSNSFFLPLRRDSTEYTIYAYE
ncbi:pyocin knob domain-containing protein [Lysinibacillus sp. NPDC086135]|uniref:pyocin knob domain-containing protein n=1 Tax=Lysinibacillus sp. NPDC086135 TaxID=3364130 RepID=UPI003816304E